MKIAAAAAAAKSLQSCPTLCDPIDCSPPGPPSLGFSKQEHWSGLPFPSPVHESEKWKGGLSVVSDSSRPHGPQPTRLLCPWNFPGKSTGVGCHRLVGLYWWPFVTPCQLRPLSSRFQKVNFKNKWIKGRRRKVKESYLLSPYRELKYRAIVLDFLLCTSCCTSFGVLWTLHFNFGV